MPVEAIPHGPGFLDEQKLPQAPVQRADLTGKVCIVTGANTGLGFETAKHLATMNPEKLILACRSQERGAAAVKKIKEVTSFEKAELWLVDFGDFASVKSFADKFNKEVGRLDILIENAALLVNETYDTTDGWEASLQVNDLGPELLALLLLPTMLNTANKFSTLPRLVVVSSSVHQWATIDQDVNIHKHIAEDFRAPKDEESRYQLAKLLNVFFVRALQSKLPTSGPSVIVNATNPGFCLSELRRNIVDSEKLKRYEIMERDVAFTSEEGSRHILYGALAGYGVPQEEEKLRGVYLHTSTLAEPSKFVLSDQGVKIQGTLWDEVVEILGKVDPRVISITKEYLK